MTEQEKALKRLAENLHRKNYTGYEQVVRITELAELTGKQGKDLAEALNCDPSWVSRMRSVAKLRPEWLEALRAEQVTISDCSEANKLSIDDQVILLESKLSGHAIGREGMKAAAQKLRQGGGKSANSTPPERSNRVKIPLAMTLKEPDAAGKVTEVNIRGIVTVASHPGEEVDLEGSETLLHEALRAVRAARTRGLGLKAAQASWKDMAAMKAKTAPAPPAAD